MTSEARLAQLHSLIIDMDGVLYRGNAPVPGAREFLTLLRELGLPFVLLTNNSTLTVGQYVDKLAGMGIAALPEDILTSGEATAEYLAREAPPGTKVYLVGEDGIRDALHSRGFVLSDDSDVAYVVVGFDRHFTYHKLTTAMRAIRCGARFIGTNPDTSFPSEAGLLPGAGALLAGIQAAAGAAPLVIGKPQLHIFELALQRLKAEPRTTAVIGDGLCTDIEGGRRLGLLTVLVLSGVTDAQELARSGIKPDLVYADIAALHMAWRAALERPGRKT